MHIYAYIYIYIHTICLYIYIYIYIYIFCTKVKRQIGLLLLKPLIKFPPLVIFQKKIFVKKIDLFIFSKLICYIEFDIQCTVGLAYPLVRRFSGLTLRDRYSNNDSL